MNESDQARVAAEPHERASTPKTSQKQIRCRRHRRSPWQRIFRVPRRSKILPESAWQGLRVRVSSRSPILRRSGPVHRWRLAARFARENRLSLPFENLLVPELRSRPSTHERGIGQELDPSCRPRVAGSQHDGCFSKRYPTLVFLTLPTDHLPGERLRCSVRIVDRLL